MPRTEFSDGQAHTWISTWCDHAEKVIHARAAQQMVNDGLSGPVAAMPVWEWRKSNIPMGRKDRASDGGQLVMPIRKVWKPGDVMVVDHAIEASWSISGLGHIDDGVVLVSSANADLAELVAAGNLAHWEMLEMMKPLVAMKVARASATLASEVDADAVLDREEIEQVIDEVILGQDGEPMGMKIISRALQPTALSRVDPYHYISEAVRSAAWSAVRRRAGDPHAGSKIRRIAKEMGGLNGKDDWDQLKSIYAERHPGDVALGAKRAYAALTLGPSVGSSAGVDLEAIL